MALKASGASIQMEKFMRVEKSFIKVLTLGIMNAHKIGILMMGDFDEQWWDFDDSLSDSHVATLSSLIDTLKSHFNILKLGGHNEFLTTGNYSCPGNLILQNLDKLRVAHGLTKP